MTADRTLGMRSRNSTSGFTLVELMIAVVIIAILATIAVVSYKRNSQRARTSEAVNFLMEIKLRQETYYTTYSSYVTTGTTSSEYYPSTLPTPSSTEPKAWDITCPASATVPKRWCALGARPSFGACASGTTSASGQCTYHQFLVAGWSPGAAAPSSSLITNAKKPWWYARAKGDLDFDGITSDWFFSSETSTVYNKAGDSI